MVLRGQTRGPGEGGPVRREDMGIEPLHEGWMRNVSTVCHRGMSAWTGKVILVVQAAETFDTQPSWRDAVAVVKDVWVGQ